MMEVRADFRVKGVQTHDLSIKVNVLYPLSHILYVCCFSVFSVKCVKGEFNFQPGAGLKNKPNVDVVTQTGLFTAMA